MSMKLKIPKANPRNLTVFVVFVVLFCASLFFGYQYFQSQKNAQDPNFANKQVLNEVSKLVLLPQDEQPTIATVTDVTKLTTQPFFAKAQNGDKVLIFANARKAVLFRPAINKVIEIGPVSGEATASVKATVNDQKAEKTFKVAIYNGTTTAGLAKKIEGVIKAKFPNEQSVILGNAQKNDYQKTLVVDVTGQRNDDAKSIADSIKAEVGSKPDGETFADADFVVIVGADAI